MKQIHENLASISDRVKLFRGLLSGRKALSAPFFSVFEITRRCNLACPGCYFHSPEVGRLSAEDKRVKDMSLELFEKACGELSAMGTKEIIISGEGEPLLHADLIPMIRCAKRKGLHVTLLTNGVLIEKLDLHELVGSGLDIVRVSLWATSREIYKKSYPGESGKNFDRIMEGLQKLKAVKSAKNAKTPLVTIHHPITKNNYADISSIRDIALAAGIGAVSFSPLRNWGKTSYDLMLDPDDLDCLQILLEALRTELKVHGIKHNIDSLLLRYKIGENVLRHTGCYIAWYYTRVRIDGAIKPCGTCELDFGNINTQSFEEIWNNQHYQAFRRFLIKPQKDEFYSEKCDCRYCCHLLPNYRIDRIFKWFRPFVG